MPIRRIASGAGFQYAGRDNPDQEGPGSLELQDYLSDIKSERTEYVRFVG